MQLDQFVKWCVISRHIHRRIPRRSGQSITSSVQGFLTHCTDHTARGGSPGMIPSKKQCYIRTKFTPVVAGLISSLPAHTWCENNNLCQGVLDSETSRSLHVVVLTGHFSYANTKSYGVQAKKRTGLHWDVALWHSVIISISAQPLMKVAALPMATA